MDGALCFSCSRIAIAERHGDGIAALVEPDVIHRPAIHCDGRDALGSAFSTDLQAFEHSTINCFDVPTEPSACLKSSIRQTVNLFDFGFVSIPMEEGYPAALRAQVHSYKSFSACR